ncbi:MAG: HAMP domain-containing sensor histidine kinase [Gemmatimonadales bacterium]
MLPAAAPRRLVQVALALTLVFSGALALNALVTARYHRSVAEGVLRDYAAFAAAELENRIRVGLATRLSPPLNPLVGRLDRAPALDWPDSLELRAEVDSTVWRALGGALLPFVLDGARLETPPRATLPEATRARLVDTLRPHLDAVLTDRSYFALLWLDQEPGGYLAVLAPPRPSRRVIGYLVPAETVGRLLAPTLERSPLLPPSLTRGLTLDSLVRYRVRSPAGRLLAGRADSVATGFAAADTLRQIWGDLAIDVALDPSLAGRLVIGGLPGSRLPLVLTLFGLSALLVGVAGYQLGRERQLARLREDFVAGVSHELRTPLAQLRLFAETLLLGRVRSPDEERRALQIIDQEARRLGHLVDNLLAVSRAGRGALRITPRDTDLSAVIREAVEGFAPLASQRGITVELSAPPRLHGVVDGDALRQIVLNLLDNAVKYGPADARVAVGLERADGWLRLRVDDRGPGIPAEARDEVFRPFVRLDNGRESTGTGLGLALVRSLAVLHGGRTRVEEAPEGGARLVVELPAGDEKPGATT